jgi:hypothetical protein
MLNLVTIQSRAPYFRFLAPKPKTSGAETEISVSVVEKKAAEPEKKSPEVKPYASPGVNVVQLILQL